MGDILYCMYLTLYVCMQSMNDILSISTFACIVSRGQEGEGGKCLFLIWFLVGKLEWMESRSV